MLEVLDEKPYKAQYGNAYAAQFDELKKKAETCNNVTILRSYADQADAVRIRLLNEMDKRDEKLTPPTPPTPPTGGAYLTALRRRLESELDPDTIVNVEF